MRRESEKKTIRITVRFKPKEAIRIQKEADKYCLTPSAYLRMMANQTVQDNPEIRSQLKQLINEVNHIGNNINQIAKNNNSELYFENDKRRLLGYMKKLNTMMDEVVKLVGDL